MKFVSQSTIGTPQSNKSTTFLTVAPEPSVPRAAKPVIVQGAEQISDNASGRSRGGRGRPRAGRQRARGRRGLAQEQSSKFYISIKFWWLNIRGT